VYREVKGYNDIVDAGFNFALNDLKTSDFVLNFRAMYHSNQSVGLGFGMDQKYFPGTWPITWKQAPSAITHQAPLR